MKEDKLKEIKAKLKKSGLTSEEVALLYHIEMKDRIMDLLPLVAGLVCEFMIPTNAEEMEMNLDLNKLGRRMEMKFISKELKSVKQRKT